MMQFCRRATPWNSRTLHLVIENCLSRLGTATTLRPFSWHSLQARAMATMNLAPLSDVKRLSPVCIRILGGNPGKFTLQGTNTYLLGSGKHRILIDSGEGASIWAASLRKVLRAEGATVDTLLLSHWHHDHVGGIEDLRKISPQAVVYKFDPGEGQLKIENGQIFRTDGVTLTAHHTPGHTTDHLVFTLAEEDAMFTADNVLGEGTAVFEDMTTYISSLHKMKTLFHGRAYPGHGSFINDGPRKIVEYINHRKQREEQVVQVMRCAKADGNRHWTGMDIVKVVYKEVHEDLHPAACAGVLQILSKLEQEGRAVRADGSDAGDAGDSWALTGQAAL